MPDVQEIPDDTEAIASTAGEDQNVELLLAGFRACAKEAIRFLLEEEGLAPDHELPMGLQEHLDRQQSHLVGMLQNDSGFGIDDSFCCTSADDDSFLASESTDTDCIEEAARSVVDSNPSNTTTDSVPSSSNEHLINESLKDSSQ